MRGTRSFQALAIALALAGVGCSGGGDDAAPATTADAGASAETAAAGGAATPASGDAAKGAELYANVCTACHGGSPSKAGSAGPAIAGSSYELLEAKILRGEYPPGYQPKRGSRAMPPLPYLKDHVADIAAFLQAEQDS